MADLSQSDRSRRLPRYYWPLALGRVIVVMLVAIVLSVTLGGNPYIAASVGGSVWTLAETWKLKRRGF